EDGIGRCREREVDQVEEQAAHVPRGQVQRGEHQQVQEGVPRGEIGARPWHRHRERHVRPGVQRVLHLVAVPSGRLQRAGDLILGRTRSKRRAHELIQFLRCCRHALPPIGRFLARIYQPHAARAAGLLSPKRSSAAPPAARRGPGTVALGALLVYSRLLGMGAIWEGLLAEQYLRVFKNAVEETTELLGYVLIAAAAVTYAVRPQASSGLGRSVSIL